MNEIRVGLFIKNNKGLWLKLSKSSIWLSGKPLLLTCNDFSSKQSSEWVLCLHAFLACFPVGDGHILRFCFLTRNVWRLDTRCHWCYSRMITSHCVFHTQRGCRLNYCRPSMSRAVSAYESISAAWSNTWGIVLNVHGLNQKCLLSHEVCFFNGQEQLCNQIPMLIKPNSDWWIKFK